MDAGGRRWAWQAEEHIKRFFVKGLFRGRCEVALASAGRAVAAGGVYQCKTLKTGREHWCATRYDRQSIQHRFLSPALGGGGRNRLL